MSGLQNDESVACVHTLARVYKVAQLLAEDLAEHMLLELGSMVTSSATENDTWDINQRNSMKASIITLMKSSGQETTCKEAGSMKTLFDLLQAYCTGTQRSKEWK